MKNKYLYISALCACVATSASANWQYPGWYKRDIWDTDDGMRFVLSVRGGAAYGHAKIENNIGGLTSEYVQDTATGEIVPTAWWNSVGQPAGYTDAGYGRLGDLPAANDFRKVSFTAGFSAGLTLPQASQWRIEFGFDHIAETDYNETPLFDGRLKLSSGYVVDAQSGGVQSKITSDVYSISVFYDIFNGDIRPAHTLIPYIGAGLGYADTKTVLQLTDSYGDLSAVYDLKNFGTVDDGGVIQFNKSETNTSNLAPMAAVGVSYGVTEKVFMDFGIRAMYLPEVKWELTGTDEGGDEIHREWFSAENMLYLNAMLGLRIEF